MAPQDIGRIRRIAIGEAGALCRRSAACYGGRAMRQGSPVRDRRCPRNCQRRARGTGHCSGNRSGREGAAGDDPEPGDLRIAPPDGLHREAERDHSSGGGGAFVAIARGPCRPRGDAAPADAGAGRRALGQEPQCRAPRRSGGLLPAPISRPPSRATTRWRRELPSTAPAAAGSGAPSRRRCFWRGPLLRRRGRIARCWSIA